VVKIVEKTCSDCGEALKLEVPEGSYSRYAKMLGVICDKCTEEEKQEVREREAQTMKDNLVKRTIASGIPDDLRGVDFSKVDVTPENTEAVAAARSWAGGGFKGLLLAGPVGVGKTYCAAAAANGMLIHRALRWFSVTRMMAQARAGFKNPARDDLYEVLLNPRMALVLDDMDKANPTDFARDILFQAIDERVNHGTPLLITTNMRYTELEKRYGEALASRLGYCKAFRIEGKDRRKGQNK
jgi:DNA replication protein DnaC